MHVVMIGSSIFAQWAACADAFPGAAVTNRAIGGTTTNDWLTPIAEVLATEQPDLVACYCGSNDVNHGVPATTTIANLRTIAAAVVDAGAVFVFYPVIKAPQKRGHYAHIDAINDAVAADPGVLTPVDFNAVVCEQSADIAGYYQPDQLHLTELAYQRMAAHQRDVWWVEYRSQR